MTIHPSLHRRAIGGGIAAATLALAVACSSAATPSSGSTAAAGGQGSTAAASGQLLATRSTPLGVILVDGQAHTVYQFAKDTPNTSACTGECATVWPPVTAPSTLPPSLPGVSGRLGAIPRDSGRQLTIDQRPVYTFTGDQSAGQMNGQGKVINGGLWTVLSPAGAPINGATPTTGSGGGYGGGGY